MLYLTFPAERNLIQSAWCCHCCVRRWRQGRCSRCPLSLTNQEIPATPAIQLTTSAFQPFGYLHTRRPRRLGPPSENSDGLLGYRRLTSSNSPRPAHALTGETPFLTRRFVTNSGLPQRHSTNGRESGRRQTAGPSIGRVPFLWPSHSGRLTAPRKRGGRRQATSAHLTSWWWWTTMGIRSFWTWSKSSSVS